VTGRAHAAPSGCPPDDAPDDAPQVAERLRFPAAPATYGAAGAGTSSVEIVETHMAWVVFAGERVWQLKKPVRAPYLDVSTLAAREHACPGELRLNARLAPGVDLGPDPPCRDERPLSLVPEAAHDRGGRTLDWRVRMRRLPHARMLDTLLARGSATEDDIDALGETLVAFYRRAHPPPPDRDGCVAQFERGHATNAAMPSDPRLALRDAPDRFGVALTRAEGLLRARCLQGGGSRWPRRPAARARVPRAPAGDRLEAADVPVAAPRVDHREPDRPRQPRLEVLPPEPRPPDPARVAAPRSATRSGRTASCRGPCARRRGRARPR
jgi:hypothetical protein